MAGTTIAQAIPIAISPILTRLYAPEDFGVFALYMSIVSILSVIVTWQYELAIMLPKRNRDALNILFLSIALTILTSFFLFIIVVLFNTQITNLLNNQDISKWLYLTPFSILSIGLFNSFNYWFNRDKNYKLLATTKVTRSFINSSMNLIFGFLKLENIGLILSSFISQLFTIVLFIRNFHFQDIKLFSKKRTLILLRKYMKFPKVTLPHSIFSSLSQNLPIFIITKFFNSSDVGFYSFGNKIIMLPIGMISNAYYQVFFQSFKDERNKLTFYLHKFRQVNMIFLPLFVLLWFILPDIFAFVFSTKWRIAGEYAQILLPLLYMKFLSNLFTTTTYIYYQKQEENFVLGILITFLIFLSLMLGVYNNDIKIGLFCMMASNTSVIVFKLYRSFKFVKENKC
jgi:O-antigen/teichoic acid export membrane protein